MNQQKRALENEETVEAKARAIEDLLASSSAQPSTLDVASIFGPALPDIAQGSGGNVVVLSSMMVIPVS